MKLSYQNPRCQEELNNLIQDVVKNVRLLRETISRDDDDWNSEPKTLVLLTVENACLEYLLNIKK